MGKTMFWGGVTIVLIYTALPWILTRMLSIGVFRKGTVRGKIALTFDDGPDPVYTPLLLDLLRRHRIKATFFVLGSKAERYPDLVARIHAEGHQIGVHNYTHWSNWLLTPRSVRRKQVERSSEIVERIIGVRPKYYRPPWGILNLFDLWLLRNYKIVLWSVMPCDWSSRVGVARLERRMLKRLSDGDIVLLHDSGDTYGADRDAPAHMLAALERVVSQFSAKGLECVRVDEMYEAAEAMKKYQISRMKKLVLAVWMMWEWCFERLFHVEPIDRNNPLLKLRIRKYRGSQTITLGDGEQIQPGDYVAELHFDNELLLQLGKGSQSPMQLAIQLIRRTEQLMPQIRQMIDTDPKYKDVKGLYGISIIHRGAKQLGFTVVNLPRGAFAFLAHYYLRFLLSVIHPLGKDRLREKSDQLVPKIIAMSRKELIDRYSA
jgi:peptidoglycan/xylan/chitin deacetylase (PgdA/CDA1 family)